MGEILPYFLATVLASAAVHKLAARERLAAAAAQLTGLPPSLGQPLSLSAATIEAGAALALLIPTARPAGCGLAVLLWSAYALLLWRARQRGDRFDCGCSLSGPSRSTEAYPATRAALLAALAALAAALPAGSPNILSVFGALTFFALYLAAGELASASSSARSLAR
ncbi:MAG: MauE/DoxX family redox-associated membrane protein [Pseudomonadota bacterium]